MEQKETLTTTYESNEFKVIKKKLEKEGPAATNAYIEENINRWKTEKVLLAVSGCSATGKSTFINTLRGVKRGDDGYAEVGFGDTTMEATPYVHPYNPRIVYYDLPGVGTIEVKKENYINTMKVCDYDFFFIFIDKVMNEDTLWLVSELVKMGKPFCFVRSKLDEDIKNAERENIDRETVISKIRQKIEKSVEKDDTLKKAAKIFFISCVDETIGEMHALLSYVESNLDKFKCEAVISSIAVLSTDIINLKYEVLKKRLVKVSIGAAGIAATPIPAIDLVANITLLVDEMIHYIDAFGLGERRMQALESFDRSQLKCNELLFPTIEFSVFVVNKLGVYIGVMVAENFLDLLLPFVGSVISGVTSAAITYKFLKNILEDLRHDAFIVYRHIVQKQSSIRL